MSLTRLKNRLIARAITRFPRLSQPLVEKFKIPFHLVSSDNKDRLAHAMEMLNIINTYNPDYLVLALLAVYTGLQATPHDLFPTGALTGAFACSMLIACFKGLMYLQHYAARGPMSYQFLFTYS